MRDYKHYDATGIHMSMIKYKRRQARKRMLEDIFLFLSFIAVFAFFVYSLYGAIIDALGDPPTGSTTSQSTNAIHYRSGGNVHRV